MSFKLYFLILFTFFATSCGVKSKPKMPAEQVIPSYIDSYTQEESNLKK